MSFIRRILRSIALFIYFIIMGVYGFSANIGLLVFGKWFAIRKLSTVAKQWGSGIAKIIGLEINVHGDPEQVKGLIVSNHLSYIDIILLVSVFPIRFAPKSEIRKWPFLGWFVELSKPIWINRKSKRASIKTTQAISETIKNKINLVIFPEGTTTNGEKILPFKSSMFESAIRGKFNICPVLIYYSSNNPYEVCWYGDATFLDHVWRLLGAKKTRADIYILEQIPYNRYKSRKELSQNVHKYMEEEYIKIKAAS